MTEYFAYSQTRGFYVPNERDLVPNPNDDGYIYAAKLPIWDEGQELADFLEENHFQPTALAVDGGKEGQPSFEIYIRKTGVSKEIEYGTYACLFMLDLDVRDEEPPAVLIFTPTAADGFDLRLRLRRDWVHGHLFRN
jgi:hypothetical protein